MSLGLIVGEYDGDMGELVGMVDPVGASDGEGSDPGPARQFVQQSHKTRKSLLDDSRQSTHNVSSSKDLSAHIVSSTLPDK